MQRLLFLRFLHRAAFHWRFYCESMTFPIIRCILSFSFSSALYIYAPELLSFSAHTSYYAQKRPEV
jgi:hypothetical protein